MESRRPAKWPVFIVRALVWIAVAVLAYPVVTAPAPEQPQPVKGSAPAAISFSTERSAAKGANAIDEARADSAPKQQVVSGWYSNELLNILSEQQDAILEMQQALIEQEPAPLPVRDDRPTTLLGFLVLGIAADLVLTSFTALIVLVVHRFVREPKQPKPVSGPQSQPASGTQTQPTPPPDPLGPSVGRVPPAGAFPAGPPQPESQ